MPGRLVHARKKVVGTKQTLKVLQGDQPVQVVYIADDADHHVINPIRKLCSQKSVEIVNMDTMQRLGRECGITIGAAVAAILGD